MWRREFLVRGRIKKLAARMEGSLFTRMENEIYTRWMKRGFDGKFLLGVLAR